jgi:hypothetical protein
MMADHVRLFDSKLIRVVEPQLSRNPRLSLIRGRLCAPQIFAGANEISSIGF